MSTDRGQEVARALADAFLGAPVWLPSALLARAELVIGARPPWLAAVAVTAATAYQEPPRDAPGELAGFLAASSALEAGLLAGNPTVTARGRRRRAPVRVVRRLPASTAMGRTRWPVVPLDDLGDLARLLDVDPGHVAWYADGQGRQRLDPPGRLHLYRRAWLPRPGRTPRLLEVPTPRLRRVHRLVLDQVLAPVPAHPAAHGFVPGRSALTGARQHVGAGVVVSMDLLSFFATVHVRRVYWVLRTAGYPEPVASALAGICTVATPVADLRAMPAGGDDQERSALRRALAAPHLPQGSPSAPHLANLCAQRLDRRLAGYAGSVGAVYTRYADDLTFSGRFRAGPLISGVGAVVREEGFRLNVDKTRVRGRGSRQSVTGIVVNERPTVPRPEYDALRAQLFNAARRGPSARDLAEHPDLRAHLTGRVAWVAQLDPERGRRLRALLDRVDWSGPAS
ncbi:RNA-directed DNA polymerase [Modestobacter sp. I12A-02628]|uniref:RNA-directed DNA polymerase n=1 Tax=Goekera deserti TaxID=2497753 RepID=A0A7K3WFM4_9ACTN|nr:reverse transcriptase family protein [Goekera deserti]MPR00051.1 RNA-directed DNA polymerase [Goekera deserti]NDI49830.1 RNA-directed DNA polymerase [Goekera deserti]NEL55192.1 RNA-directed DNA polymerase [Goekera deserti]